MLDRIADDLRRQGFSICPDFLPLSEVQALTDEIDSPHTRFHAAGIGRGDAFQRDAGIRSDRICWLDPAAPLQADFLTRMERLRVQLNRTLLLGLFDYEGHFAYYPPGARYRRHRDAFCRRGPGDARPQRVLSTVVYLNRDWQAADGGELVLYDSEDRVLETLLPQAGLAVVFLSEEFPHEVLPARRERRSIAGWFRRRSG